MKKEMKNLCFLIGALLTGIVHSQAQSPWDTTAVDSKVLIRFNAAVAGITIDEASSEDKIYLRALWDSIVEASADDKLYMRGFRSAFTCGSSTVTYDGYTYGTVAIGDQCFFKQNLRTTQFTDGSSISEVTDGTAWSGLATPAYCKYDNDASNGSKYGLLYNWWVVENDNICPSGWHVPSETEWATFTTTLGGATTESATKLKAKATDTPPWDGDNSSKFSVVPGGQRQDAGNFLFEGARAAFWSTTPSSGGSAQIRRVATTLESTDNDYNFGLAIRCLQDAD